MVAFDAHPHRKPAHIVGYPEEQAAVGLLHLSRQLLALSVLHAEIGNLVAQDLPQAPQQRLVTVEDHLAVGLQTL